MRLLRRNESSRLTVVTGCCVLIAATLLLCTARWVRAIDYSWDNYSGDSNFATELNWNPYPGGPPIAGDTAIFNGALAGSGIGNNTVNVADGTAIEVMQVVDTATVDLTIGDGTTGSRFDLDDIGGDSLVVGDSFGDTATLNLLGGWLDTIKTTVGGRATLNLLGGRLDTWQTSVGGQATLNVTGPGSLWDSTDTIISGDTSVTTASVQLTNQADIVTQGSLDVGSDTGSGRAVADGTVIGIGSPAEWIVTLSVDVGPTSTSGFNFGELYVQNNARMIVGDAFDVHGTSSVGSTAFVRSGGELDVASQFTIGPYGTTELSNADSVLTVGNLVSTGGTFDWTAGTLEIDDAGLVLDTASPHSVFGSSLTVGAEQKLIHSNPVVFGAGDTLTVGHSTGSGQLTIENAGEIESVRGIVGALGTSIGTAAVRGNGSRWTISDQLRLGSQDSAQGQLTVENGGEVSAAIVFLGFAHSADGGVTVDGIGSRLTSNTSLIVAGNDGAAGGTGELTVRNDAEVNVATTLKNWTDGTIRLEGGAITTESFVNQDGGTFVHDDGTLTVDGGSFAPVQNGAFYWIDGIDAFATPSVVLDNGATGTVNPSELRVGSLHQGQLTLQNGSSLTVDGDAYVAWNVFTDTFGDLAVTGGSYLGVTGDLEVGDGRTGLLMVAAGSLVDSSGVGTLGRDVIGDDPTAIGAAQVTGTFSHWTTDTLLVGNRGVGHLVIDDGGLVQTYGDAQIGVYSSFADGSVAVADPASLWEVHGNLYVSGDNMGSAGNTATLTIDNGGTVEVDPTGMVGSTDGLLKVYAPGTVNVNAGGTLDADTIELLPGATFITQTESLVRTNRLVGFGANPNFSGHLAIGTYNGGNFGSVSVGAGETLTAQTFQLGGNDMNSVSGQIRAEVGAVITATEPTMGAPTLTVAKTGLLYGDATIVANVKNRGNVGPGDSGFYGGNLLFDYEPGLISVTGSYEQTLLGILVLNLNGTTPVVEYDQLDVLGDVTLDGDLGVGLLGGFELEFGQSFDIINVGGALVGWFSGLPEGSLVTSSGPVDLFITYASGDGNNVALYTLPPTPGDGNGDGKVDGLDYLIWADHFGDNPALDPPGSPENGDYNEDGIVDGVDYLTWASHFGKGPNDAVPVPEPTSLALLIVGCAIVPRWRKP